MQCLFPKPRPIQSKWGFPRDQPETQMHCLTSLSKNKNDHFQDSTKDPLNFTYFYLKYVRNELSQLLHYWLSLTPARGRV